MDEKELQSGSGKPDLFIAQFNQNGELNWMNKIGMDSTAENESLGYLVKFDRSGENLSFQWSDEDERNMRNGFTKPNETGLSFVGSGSFTTDMIPLARMSTKSDIFKDFNNEFNKQADKNSHPTVTGVLALMKMLQKSGTEVTGNQLLNLIIRYNPAFQVNNPLFFNAIGLVDHLKNENGIVVLKTIGSKTIQYGNLKLEDGARFNISVFDNGDLSVGIISGIQKVVMQVALPLNSILIDSSSGNMIFDFDHDHTLKTVSYETLFSAK